MNWTSTAVIRKQRQWTVQVESSAGESAELSYATEAQARYFAAVLELRPSMLPRAAIARGARKENPARPALSITPAPRELV